MALVGVHVLGAAGQVLSGRVQRLSLGAAWRPAGSGVQVVSGVLAGPANTQGELSLAGNLLTVQAFRAIIQSALDATAGSYVVPNDAAFTFPALTAQHASQFRRSLVVVRVDDSQVSGVASSGTTDRATLEVIDGALAASSGATVLPTPAGSWLALGEILIPPVGQTITVTPYNPRTTTRGGILPVLADGSTITGHDGALGLNVGQVRDHPTRGLERWDGNVWEPLLSAVTAWNPTTGNLASATVPFQISYTQSLGHPSGWVVGAPSILRPVAGAGVYDFVGYAAFAANATGTRGMAFRVNAGAWLYTEVRPAAPAAFGTHVSGTYPGVQLAAGDSVEMGLFQDSGVANTLAMVRASIRRVA